MMQMPFFANIARNVFRNFMKVKVGTCGFGRAKKPDYAKSLGIVEIQHTFYQPPEIKTLEKWRAEMPEDFEFTVKAWQLITHQSKSPTYRRLTMELTPEQREGLGSFKPTKIVDLGWETTLASAKALNAATILFQCPASFKPYPENIDNLHRFFERIDRQDLNFVWEPRGGWDADIVAEICEAHDLWHVVDPFQDRTTTPDKCYFRLHGINGWRYKYSDEELEDLAGILPKNKPSFVFFNNSEMFKDAVRFREMIGG